MDEVIDSAQTSNITEESAPQTWGISYYPMVRNKRNKKQEGRRTILERRIESNINAALHEDVSLIERLEIGILRK